MHHFDLRYSWVSLICIDLDHPGFVTFWCKNWIFPSKIQIDGSIQSLDFILDKKRNFDVFVLEKLKHLLLDDLEFITIELVYEK